MPSKFAPIGAVLAACLSVPQARAAKRIDDARETAGFTNTAMVCVEGDQRRSCSGNRLITGKVD